MNEEEEDEEEEEDSSFFIDGLSSKLASKHELVFVSCWGPVVHLQFFLFLNFSI